MKADYKKQKSALHLALSRCKNRVGARAVREKMSGFDLLASKKCPIVLAELIDAIRAILSGTDH